MRHFNVLVPPYLVVHARTLVTVFSASSTSFLARPPWDDDAAHVSIATRRLGVY
jgi:hypothetical protein